MLEAAQYSATGGKRRSKFALPEADFDGTVNQAAMHASVRVFMNNLRQGTHKTKTRGEVSGGGAKPWRQKGTGRARAGTIRAAQWRGGGIVFGPRPRDYRTGIPRRVRQLGRRSALNARAHEQALLVIEDLAFDAPKTAQLAQVLAEVGVIDRKVLLLTNGAKNPIYLSGRNLPAVHVMPYAEATAYEVLWSDVVVIEESVFGTDGEAVSVEVEDEKVDEKVVKAETAPTAAKKVVKKKTAKAATKKTTARKTAAKKTSKKSAKKATKKTTAKKATKKKGGK
jgi:large subunit ribosomal protein L4